MVRRVIRRFFRLKYFNIVLQKIWKYLAYIKILLFKNKYERTLLDYAGNLIIYIILTCEKCIRKKKRGGSLPLRSQVLTHGSFDTMLRIYSTTVRSCPLPPLREVILKDEIWKFCFAKLQAQVQDLIHKLPFYYLRHPRNAPATYHRRFQ